jgi:hypothetical protein
LPPFRLKWVELSNEGIRRVRNEISLRKAGIVETGVEVDLGNFAHLTTTERPPTGSDRQEAPRGLTSATLNRDAPTRIGATPSRRTKSRPLYDRARQVIDALFRGHVPGLADLSDRDLCDLVRKNLGETKRKMSNATILRAAGRK